MPLDEIPEVGREYDYFWEYFWLLNRTRRYEQGIPLPILFSEIKAIIDLYGKPISDIRSFIDVILSTDDYYLDKIQRQGLEKADRTLNKNKKRKDV